MPPKLHLRTIDIGFKSLSITFGNGDALAPEDDLVSLDGGYFLQIDDKGAVHTHKLLGG